MSANDPTTKTDSQQPLNYWLKTATEVCQDAAKGNLESRILNIDAGPEVEELLHSINHLLDMTDAFLRESAATLDHAGQGKFYRTVLAGGMRGSFKQAAHTINQGTDSMQGNAAALHEAEQKRAELSESFQHAANSMTGLSNASKEIGNMSKVITEIASQSKLLALNATIESARAGDAGAGFAVVANEIKIMSNQTAEATKDIAAKVEAIQDASSTVGTAIDHIWATVKAS